MGIAEAAIAAAQQLDALAGFGQVGDQGFTVFFVDLGADGYLHDGVLAVGAGHDLALAAFAGLGLHMLLVAIVEQGVAIFHRNRPDIAALAAVTAIGAAILDELLAPERNTAVAASTAGRINLGDIEKAHLFCLYFRRAANGKPLHTFPGRRS